MSADLNGIEIDVIVANESAAQNWSGKPLGASNVVVARDEGDAIRKATTSEGLAVIVTGESVPPIDLEKMLSAATCSPALRGVSWLALTSKGFAADDGAHVDHTVYPSGPFTPPYGPLRATTRGAGGLTVVRAEALSQVGVADSIDDLDRLFEHGWERGHGSFISPWLRPIAIADRHPEYTIDPAPEDRLTAWLTTVRPEPSIAVAVRSTGDRHDLLRRNLAALSAAHNRSPIQEVLVLAPSLGSADDPITLAPPELPMNHIEVAPSDIPGRTAAMIRAVEHATSDYIWFVDDDDSVTPESTMRIRNAVHGSSHPIIVGATAAFDEVWKPGAPKPESRAEVRAHNPYEWYRSFSGWNPTPNCGLVMPVELAMRRLTDIDLRHDLGEDFALQLLLLTAPGATVAVAPKRIAEVSVRHGGDNTITSENRINWQRNMSAFLRDLAENNLVQSQALWDLGRAMRKLPPRPWDGSPGGRRVPSRLQTLAWRWIPHRVRRAGRKPPFSN